MASNHLQCGAALCSLFHTGGNEWGRMKREPRAGMEFDWLCRKGWRTPHPFRWSCQHTMFRPSLFYLFCSKSICLACIILENRSGDKHTTVNLIFICPCIANMIPNYNQNATFLDLFISTDTLRVSGGSSAHHQEYITVHTASGIVNQYCC